MKNHTSMDTILIFTSYESFHPFNECLFTVIIIFYLLSIFCNFFLMLTIYFESSLHKPMYIFLFNLTVNGLIGSSTIWPKVMDNLLSNTKNISFLACLVQVFWCYFYVSSAYTAFSVMAYDRYVSICKPLQYHNIMTPGKMKKLLTVANIAPLASISILTYLTSRLSLCRYSIQNLFCDIVTLINISCVKSALVNLFGVCLVTIFVVFPCIVVLLSYVVILKVSLKASKDAQKRALSTCSPHLITFGNFALAILFFAVYYRYSSFFPGEVYILLTVDIFLIPPLLNPIIYGIRTREIRKSLVKIVRTKQRFLRNF